MDHNRFTALAAGDTVTWNDHGTVFRWGTVVTTDSRVGMALVTPAGLSSNPWNNRWIDRALLRG